MDPAEQRERLSAQAKGRERDADARKVGLHPEVTIRACGRQLEQEKHQDRQGGCEGNPRELRPQREDDQGEGRVRERATDRLIDG
jgi:hypothetical protein